jgi:hypothetical protein
LRSFVEELGWHLGSIAYLATAAGIYTGGEWIYHRMGFEDDFVLEVLRWGSTATFLLKGASRYIVEFITLIADLLRKIRSKKD